jgi:GDP-4-dehydro-6-deoxy-D-mannose reductase
MSRVLVTGGTGFVGSYLVPYLQSNGDDVTVLASRSNPSMNSSTHYYDVDVRHTAAVRAVVRDSAPDFIYHLAAISTLAMAATNPELTYEVNVLGAYNIFEAAMNQSSPVRVLNISSSQVYAPSASRLNEDAPVVPAGPYASSKAMTEVLAKQYRERSGGGIITARPFNHTGPGQSEDFVLSSIAKQFAEIEIGRRKPTLSLGNIQVKRDFTDVRDVVRAYKAVVIGGTLGEVYNVCSGIAISIEEILEIFQRIANVKVSVEVDPNRVRENDVPTISGDASKIARNTGWHPTIELPETLMDLLNYWRSRFTSTETTLDEFCA